MAQSMTLASQVSSSTTHEDDVPVIPERESDVERICQAALEVERAKRAAFLAQACAGDDALRRDVESLLARESKAEGVGSGNSGA